MKLYFYYLKENEVKKDVQANVRSNKRYYIIPAGGKSRISGTREWNLEKECCDIVQVDSSLWKWSPFIISDRSDLDSIPGLAEMLIAVSEKCIVTNNQIKVYGNTSNQ